jgi:neutral ceramidase
MIRRFFEVIFSFVAMAALTGCVLFTKGAPLDVPSYELPAPAPFVDSFRAGVGKVDITPPAGFPTGGHGPAGSMARGAWTRLYARAFVFADAQGNVAVFVSCDLFAIPGGLTARVAREVGIRSKARDITIPPEAITLAATHTHQSPGNFLTAAAYNEAASKYSGFSRELFDFLELQITSAIELAIEDALQSGRADLRLLKGSAYSLQLNRSPRTFMLNADALPTMETLHPQRIPVPACEPVHEAGEARGDFRLHGCPRRRAADPALNVLEITRNGQLVGAMVFYAGHPTVLDPPAPIYSSDFTGVAMSALETRRSSASTPLFGFFNGAEGDIVVKRSVRDVREVVAVGNDFADRVERLLDSPPQAFAVRPAITVRGAMLNTTLKSDRVCGEHSFAEKPLMGAPALGGAEDDRTVFYGLGYRKGLLDIAKDGQGGKLGAFDSQLIPGLRLTDIVAPPRKFPKELPLRYVKIGNFVLATVPGEFSTMAGRRLVERLQGEEGAHDHIVVVGLANEYTGYVTTSEEYAAQDYMAASTLWGPDEAEVFTCRLEKLKADARDAAPAPKEPIVVKKKRYFPGHPPEEYNAKLRFGQHGVGEQRSAADEELGEILLDQRGVPARGLPMVFWKEPMAYEEFEVVARRRVAIRRAGETMGGSVTSGAGRLPEADMEDDSGTGFVTLIRNAPEPRDANRMMAAIWLRPILDDGFAEDLYRFRIEYRDADDRLVRLCEAEPFKASRESATQPNQPQEADCRLISAGDEDRYK